MLTTEYDLKELLKAFKKEFACNGTIVDDEELGQVIQLQGDQRQKISMFLCVQICIAAYTALKRASRSRTSRCTAFNCTDASVRGTRSAVYRSATRVHAVPPYVVVYASAGVDAYVALHSNAPTCPLRPHD